jgi:hypothetical protein
VAGVTERNWDVAALFARAVSLEHHRGNDEYDLRRPRAHLGLGRVPVLTDGETRSRSSYLRRAGVTNIDCPHALDVENPRLRRLREDGQTREEEQKSG